MKINLSARSWLAAALLAIPLAALAAGSHIGPASLRARHAALAPELARNDFGRPLALRSEEVPPRIEGQVFAVLDHPFPQVAAVLADPGRWCDILILHLNTKHCRRVEADGATQVQVRVGRKEPQAVQEAALLAFEWRPAQQRADYVAVQMDAQEGPYDTRDYRLLAEAVPLDNGRTFLHMGYAFSHGSSSRLAIRLYLATIGRNKVGFTREHPTSSTDEGFVGGMRGVAERNTMRYYLAIDAYLQSLSAAPEQQLDTRLAAWFDATERYPRQLHEVERDAYLRMKRAEVRRQLEAP